jgi:hypothetical protein
MFEIVKREHTRFVRHLVLQPASAPAGSTVRVCSASNAFDLQRIKSRSFLDPCPVFAERAPIIRVIKCLKSIWWMPWR